MPEQAVVAQFVTELQQARDLARLAGAAILKHYNPQMEVERKDDDTPVTQADRDANAIIVDGLRRAFPGDGVLAEESAEDSEDVAKRLKNRRLWCVDPLDGTKEFIIFNGQFCVMIGLAVDGEAKVGVVYQPTEDFMIWGAVGGEVGASRGDQKLNVAVSNVSQFDDATIMLSRAHPSKSLTEIGSVLGISRIKCLGSVGLKVAEIALGGAELYVSPTTYTSEWDACGPEAILRAAGGLVTDMRGKPLRYNKRIPNTPFGIVATNAQNSLRDPLVEQLPPLLERCIRAP